MSSTLPPPIVIHPGERPAAEDLRLAQARLLAKLMDTAWVIPGTSIRIGLDAILGLLPGIGDAIASVIGGYIVIIAAQMGVPRAVIWRMMLNLGIDTVVGSVPIIGDMLDVAWKANVMNVALLERALADPRSARRSSTWFFVGIGAAAILLGALGGVIAWLVIRAAVGHS